MGKRKAHRKQRGRPQRQKYRSFDDFLPPELVNVCPRPEKKKFKFQEDAEDFINKLHSRSTVKYGEHYLPDRSYQCACGFWHVTSKKQYVAPEVIESGIERSITT